MTRFEKWSVLSTSLATGVTGVGYLWVKYFVEPVEPWAVINHPLQPWLLKAHILVAPLLVFAVGMIAVRHVWQHIRRRIRLGRRSGLTVALSLLPMVASGYLIQAITAEGWLETMAIGHIATGLLYGVGLAVHTVVAGRRRSTAARSHPHARIRAKRRPAREPGAPSTSGQ